MAAVKREIIVEDYDDRCEFIFPESQERCWIRSSKVIKMGGVSHHYCSFHYQAGLIALAQSIVGDKAVIKEQDPKEGEGNGTDGKG